MDSNNKNKDTGFIKGFLAGLIAIIIFIVVALPLITGHGTFPELLNSIFNKTEENNIQEPVVATPDNKDNNKTDQPEDPTVSNNISSDSKEAEPEEKPETNKPVKESLSFSDFLDSDNTHSEYKLGDTITFGKYYYENNQKKEDLEWTIVGISDDYALITTKNVIDSVYYNKDDIMPEPFMSLDTYWDRCTLRNEYIPDFVEIALSKEEQSKLADYKTVDTDIDGNHTVSYDKVFILSFEEIQSLMTYETANAYQTPYAENQPDHMQDYYDEGMYRYWLRDSESYGDNGGIFAYFNMYCENNEILKQKTKGYFTTAPVFILGFRPACVIRLD